MADTNELIAAANTAFIDQAISSNTLLQPKFISNDYKKGKKVLAAIESELQNCGEFMISVAFITEAGIEPLLQILEQLDKNGIKGKVLTTNYKNFTSPKAIEKLASFKNVEVKMYHVTEGEPGFHTKGYIFKKEDVYRIIVGSSNLTAWALTKNREWNIEILSTQQGRIALDILEEFQELWKKADRLDGWFESYKKIYNEQKKIVRTEKIVSVEQYQLKPNCMQVAFTENVSKLVEDGKKRALLISATGTGKTYASAFALRSEQPKRALFIVHREQIARQAMESYKKVFGNTKTFSLLSGNIKEYDGEYVFATMQMVSKRETLEYFGKYEFEIIIIDEVHRAGANSYQKIMNYFEPKLWLGMTASPDRTDEFDIYKLFDHNIAYEIRLQQALEEELLCPFHYFGITDLEIDGEVFDEETGIKNFSKLISDDRVNYIIERAEFYGYSGERVKGLVFCSRKEEAKELSMKFQERGYRTVALTGEDSQEYREACIEQLVGNNDSNRLDYIFTVDIFNEGVDIPEVNQVLMLRPTQSPIVFVQQLGRGLRKCVEKEFLVIIDFIGNYRNNFMIPIALSGDKTYNKDNIRKYLMEGSRVIPGTSSIHFDEISKQRIFKSIDRMTTTKKLLTEKYFKVKNKLGKIPNILDFYEYGEIDPMLFIEYAKTYNRFVAAIDNEYKKELTNDEMAMLEFVSGLLVNGKRPHELIMIEILAKNEVISKDNFAKRLNELGDQFDKITYESAINVLNKEFLNTPSEKKRYERVQFLSKDQRYGKQLKRTISFYQRLTHIGFWEEMSDLIKYGLKRYHDLYSEHDENHLVLYQKYSRKDVCRLLNWKKDESSTIYGYKVKNNTCPIFVNYKKEDDISGSIKYKDEFIDNKIFSWMTKRRITKENIEVQKMIHYQEIGLKMFLFIKKSNGEGNDFYYMGEVEPIAWRETTMPDDEGRDLPIVNFKLELKNSVRDDIYDYLIK